MNLNDLKRIKKVDTGRMAESLALLSEQIKSVWQEAEKIKLPLSYFKVNKIIIFGMGGSNLGARIITSVFKEDLGVPLIIEAGYEVPNFIDQNTLCILSSYSGNTEEPLSVFKKIRAKKAKLLAIGTISNNSALENLAKKEKIPGLFFSDLFNLSGQPRAGLGYALFGLLALLNKIKILEISSLEVKKLIEKLSKSGKNLVPGVKNNSAKKIAQELIGKEVVLLASDFLEGNLHTLRNQFNENAKTFSSYLVLPEMNHYSLEGLSFPKNNKNNLIFLTFNSRLYSKRVNRRLKLTKEVIKKNKIKLVEYSLSGKNKLEQAMEMLQFGSWLTFYVGILNNINPSLIPWVNWFKKELK
ncbi:MAG: SIS domain-containing protein [Patescibacteria group bacterium]|jgi:glucose/mannose-6-phosphate isomerase